jgi:HlyD family secretion protein
VVTLLESTQLWVKVYVPEPELGHVAVGQPASIQVDSFPNQSFNGSIEQISDQAEFLPRNIQTRDDRTHQVFGVKVRLDNNSGQLKSGMAATVKLQWKQ